MELYFPTEFGEQIAFLSAALTCLIGLVPFFAPGAALRLCGVEPQHMSHAVLGSVRMVGGLRIGFAAACLLVAQPVVYLAFGAALALAAFGRALSLLADRGPIGRGGLLLIVDLVLACLPLAYVSGMV